MKSIKGSIRPDSLMCIWEPVSWCGTCQAEGKLMCHFDRKDMLHFFMIIFPYWVTTIGGVIRAGYGCYLWFWPLYGFFFFFIWEARVLCRHCPYWAEDSRVLHCHANYGVVKIWKYDPGPMSQAEKIQFIIGASLLMGFPFPFLILGQEYLLALIGLSTVISGVFLLRKNVCSRCINFSCPMNTVPDDLVDVFLEHNPAMQKAWEDQTGS